MHSAGIAFLRSPSAFFHPIRRRSCLEKEAFMSFSKWCATSRVLLVLVVLALVPSLKAATPYLPIGPIPPADLPSRGASLEDVAKFAWQEFLALNWKASIDGAHPPSPSNPRGTPDPKWNYSMPAPAYPNPVVWQTYA